jgi:circadian clock protein KaiC
MKRNIPLMHSGIELVDQAWGGFYKGGTYLLFGPRKSGRTLLGLQYAMQTAKQKEICLYFTTMRPKDLMIHAASIDFDLQSYMNQNLIIVVRVASPTDINELRNPDEYLIEYFKDIVTVVNQFMPNRIIFDELTPYLGFTNLDLLKNAFLQTLETIEEKDIISLFILGEPATPGAQAIVDSLAQQVTGTIYLQKKISQTEGKFQGGNITITPNIGHTEGQFSSNYYIEPNKGIVVDFRKSGLPQNIILPTQNIPAPKPPVVSKQDQRYLSLSSFDIPSEPYSFSNLYDYNDFLLILNNQIALFKSTGQVFNVVSFKLDPGAVQNGLLTINQLQNAVRLATDKKDKICVRENKVVVLITRGDKKAVQNLISKIQNNLPSTNPEYIKMVLSYISVLSIEIDEHIENAESLINYITSDDNVLRNNFDSFDKFKRF